MRSFSFTILLKQFFSTLFLIISICIFSHGAFAADPFIDNGDGTVTDTQTSLMWAVKDNGIPISWTDASNYCKNLETGGYSDWRMPTINELKILYAPDVKNQNGYHVARPIQTTASSCWASDTKGYKGGRFNFSHGKIFWLRKSYSGPTRVLAVRSIK